MVHYLGREWSKRELLESVGDMSQIAGIRALEMAEGRERGSRLLHVYNGSGLSFDVLPDKALDIGRLAYKGIPLTWSSSTGYVHPAYYEAQGLGWLRSFQGGLMTTCGLDQFGAPVEDNGEQFGIHGRIANSPAEQVAHHTDWHDDDYVLEINGKVRQSRLFGENLSLHRKLHINADKNELFLHDVITNDGFASQPHMVLYHCNLGFPLLGEDTELIINTKETVPRDPQAAAGIDSWMKFQKPTQDFGEQVFRHSVQPDDSNLGTVTIRNPKLGLSLTIQYSADTLPHLFQWKQMGQGAYVLGIEPANSSAIEGRAVALERDDLPMLEPGERRIYSLSFTIEEI